MTNYPDIDNSILLFPDRFRSGYHTALQRINGIDFTELGGVCSKDNLLNLQMQNGSVCYCPMLGGYFGPANTVHRITTIDTLSQLVGATIGKTIILPDIITNTSVNGLKIKVGIFHSDGTITYFDSEYTTYSNIDTYNRPGYNTRGMRGGTGNSTTSTYKYRPNSKILNTNGIVVQEGDRVYAEFTSTSDGFYFSFGGLNACFENDRLQPIQFSID